MTVRTITYDELLNSVGRNEDGKVAIQMLCDLSKPGVTTISRVNLKAGLGPKLYGKHRYLKNTSSADEGLAKIVRLGYAVECSVPGGVAFALAPGIKILFNGEPVKAEPTVAEIVAEVKQDLGGYTVFYDEGLDSLIINRDAGPDIKTYQRDGKYWFKWDGHEIEIGTDGRLIFHDVGVLVETSQGKMSFKGAKVTIFFVLVVAVVIAALGLF